MPHLNSYFAAIALAVMAPQGWAASVAVPADYETIQAAIDALEADPLLGDTIEMARGVYSENITINRAITLRGKEAAATFLEAENAAVAIVTISNAANAVVRNFTFRNGDAGVVLNNSTAAILASNVFRLGNNSQAVESDALTDVDILNNTFYDNDTAVLRGSESSTITNNIFSNNNVAISPDTLAGAVDYNCFYNNGDDGVTGTQAVTNSDPLFVSTSRGDFHLKENSPCIDAGSGTDVIDNTTADIGAYGGSYADIFPFSVQNVAASDTSASAGTPSIFVSWSANDSYLVTHSVTPGGYKLYYDSDQSAPPYEGVDAAGSTLSSPIDVGNVTSYTVSDLSPPNINPAAPVISSVAPSNQTLVVSWGAVASATGYRLNYGVNDVSENQIDVGAVTGHTLTGLINGTTYRVAVSALYQARYYLSVTAYDSTANVSHESDYSDEVSVAIGSENESALSATVTGIPESIVAYPVLPNEGCFIATAAYGYYDAPQVQLLREFRDRYLLNHAAGRWLVKQYYIYGPAAARYIETHPAWKSVVRAALLPLIAMAWFLFQASGFIQVVFVLAGIILASCFFVWRNQRMSLSANDDRSGLL